MRESRPSKKAAIYAARHHTHAISLSVLASKQGVAGSSPVSRSMPLEFRLCGPSQPRIRLAVRLGCPSLAVRAPKPWQIDREFHSIRRESVHYSRPIPVNSASPPYHFEMGNGWSGFAVQPCPLEESRRDQIERATPGTAPDLDGRAAPPLCDSLDRPSLLIAQPQVLYEPTHRDVIRIASFRDHVRDRLPQERLQRLATRTQLARVGRSPLLDDGQLAEDRKLVQRESVRDQRFAHQFTVLAEALPSSARLNAFPILRSGCSCPHHAKYPRPAGRSRTHQRARAPRQQRHPQRGNGVFFVSCRLRYLGDAVSSSLVTVSSTPRVAWYYSLQSACRKPCFPSVRPLASRTRPYHRTASHVNTITISSPDIVAMLVISWYDLRRGMPHACVLNGRGEWPRCQS